MITGRKMTTKFSLEKRALFPPPVCKKVPPYPAMPVRPPNSIIVQLVGDYDDDVGRHWTHAGFFWVWEDDPELWGPRVVEPLPGWISPEVWVSEDSSEWSINIVRVFAGFEDWYIDSGLQQSTKQKPFSVLPFSILPPEWSGFLTVEMCSA
jgi:hypothetical protein